MTDLAATNAKGRSRICAMFSGVCPTWRTCPTFLGDSDGHRWNHRFLIKVS